MTKREAERAALRAEPELVLAVVGRAITGDAVALHSLLRGLGPEMARVARVLLGRFGSEVDDVVQESLISLLRAAGLPR